MSRGLRLLNMTRSTLREQALFRMGCLHDISNSAKTIPHAFLPALKVCTLPIINSSRVNQVRHYSSETNTGSSTLTTIPGHQTTYRILREGTGVQVAKGKTVTVHATGIVKETAKKFWSTKDPGQKPFTYRAGVGEVITGWDQGLLGMRLGEERILTIPAKEGYGAMGFPAWGIPPGGTLEFTLEVLQIQ